MSGTHSQDITVLRSIRLILKDPAYKDNERAHQRLGELLVRYLQDPQKYLPVMSELQTDFPPRGD